MTRSWSFGSFRDVRRFVVPSRAALRLAAYAGVVALGAAAFAGHLALASAREGSLDFGRSLDGLAGVLGETKVVALNGLPVFVSTGTVASPLRDVLDRYEGDCETHPSTLSTLLDESRKATGAKSPRSEEAARAILRSEGATDGVVVCLARRSHDGSSAAARLASFARTMDVAEIGEPTLLYARAVSEHETHVMAVWSRGSMPLRSLFPKMGDAPGSDSPASARPTHARRVLTGTTPDAPCGIRVYQSSDPPEKAVEAFDAAMRSRGWALLHGAGGTPEQHAYVRADGAQAFVRAAASEDGTVVAVVDLNRGR